ncbi:IMP dehydrogenase [Desulfosarcina ovata subsp. sediminis]|uniref:IMP dehydrogenase n=1 Tax=Desulfosarcina ovata subsp. sediminis TaxID=885957 RepID=A0A5K7ZKN6_9BACT|nr:transglutaminase family protein [Desulfosarcina ovata]BBO82732.1 IMP dehydrogenase [Desulfosarcina ovata subsp. sediminis]
MGIHVALNHKTTYRYDRRVSLSPQVVRLRPAPHCRTPILSYSMTVTPKDHFINWQQDPFSNYLGRLVFTEKTDVFRVEVDLVAEMIIINPFDFFLEPDTKTFPFSYERRLKTDLAPYLEREPAGKRLAAYLAGIDRSPKSTIDFLVELNRRLSEEVSYLIRMEANVQSPEQTLTLGSGSCRDSAWLLVNILRHLGLAARFVSGYLIQLAPDVKSLDGPSGPEADFTDLHAWTEVYLPGAGWVGMDPTSGLFAGEGHIPLACSPEPLSAAPITGAVEKCEVEFGHTMSVRRVREEPRSTRPYPETVWDAIVALGDRVDRELETADVRLTMGGEPTFVSIDDMDGEQWNTAALGEEKRELSEQLIRKLCGQWASGGLLHYGQGKWYPGESLPRWALGCYWRTDGKPIWQDDRWIADTDKDYGFGAAEAKRFIETLADRLAVNRRFIRESYEDTLYYLYKEQLLPVNVTPTDPRLDDPEERVRMVRTFRNGLGAVAGYVLPLQYGSWKSGPWPLRSKHMFLLPGDSPAGLRLPLDSLPWVSETDYPYDHPLDPMAERGPLPDLHDGQHYLKGADEATAGDGVRPQPGPFDDPQPVVGESAAWIVRTALCVQPRNGRLYVFMPPIANLNGYLDLIAAIEATAAATGLPVVVEGYTPPNDPRINSLKITPDPGVIEVNIQPMHNWREMVDTTTTLYETARQCRLATEKFMLDGRHTGTGGGNHIVVGGATPTDSPFLRRPDLLRSLVTFWNNHPSLSFLFSGLFIGPTSQQPRIDEARHDSLYELEIAFAELDRQTGSDQPCPPWLVDRLFRHLLVDVSGNTHRAEFCIDKLYSPDSSAGRLGLLELRAFEMPPHARMSLAQQLLLRIAVAWFWKTPYRKKLVRWGTRLHDRFMLPDLVRKDFADVLTILRQAGYPVTMEFFHPHFEFRFPIYGRVVYQGMEMELRQALEPWHVLGEEPGGGGTARYVDSSVERVQVKVSGMTGERYIVACNGRRVPLQPTDAGDVFVAGIRYRAWQPPSCLHPTIGVHTPLTIDLFDTWSKRAVGGCTYHVGHPGGRNHETFPVNSWEAEGRRHARFIPGGHTPGSAEAVPDAETNPEFPYTLDLRRQTG